MPNYAYQNEEIGVYGYPGSTVPSDVHETKVCQQGAFEIGLNKVSDAMLTHHLSTEKGMSGSPVFVKR